ncbi:MAG: gamma-glutamyltransferase family protein [Acidobacteriia bacterium]|nr:gamma-glutamyltransferase family protein [Terriglobia bacterium]
MMAIPGFLARTCAMALGAGLFLPGLLSGARTLKPVVAGKRGVVAAGHPLVAEAGLRMLEKGGNAVDAGVAAVFAASVVEMTSFASGGECPILIKVKDGPVVAINGAGIAPELATVDYYEHLSPDDPRRLTMGTIGAARGGIIPAFGPLSAIVPSVEDSLLLALEKYGTLSAHEVLQPAIELAQGFPLNAVVAGALARAKPVAEKWPSTAKVYYPGGRIPKEDELFVQADLARTLESLAQVDRENASRGRVAAIEAVREYFYRGPIAQRISDFCEGAGCLLRAGDFAAYHAQVEQPLTTEYRGVQVFKCGFWTQGPVFLENLNLLEGFDLKAMGHNSADYIHTVVEAEKLGYADRDAYYGDPAFSQIPEALISKDYAKLRRPLINPVKASTEHIPGDPIHMQARASAEFAHARLSHRNGAHQDTTCVNVIDAAGNMFSATPSGGWIPAVIAGDTGIALTQRAQSYVLTPGHPNQLAPHKRPRITLTPSLALREGKPWLVFSTPGGDSQDQTLLQIFLNVVEFGMNPQEAVEAPRFNSEAMYSSFDDHSDQPLALDVESRIPAKVLDELRTRGHKLVLGGDWSNPTAPTMIEYDPATGVIKGGADIRGWRYALAW